MDLRKKEEQELHNKLRSEDLKTNKEEFEYYTSNSKFYSIDRGNKQYVLKWLQQRCKGKRVLDYCCGDGRYTFQCAEYGSESTGVDISDVTIKNCKSVAVKKGLDQHTSFHVMDAEDMDFEDNYFDIILCMGVLHHLDLQRSYSELLRVLKPDGHIICTEALGHNSIIQLYRTLTPHLRTKYEIEHILKMSDIKMAQKYFGHIETRFFHLATLAAVPFRNMFFFNKLLSVLESVDGLLLNLPFVRTQAWMVVFELSKPRK